MSVARLLPSAFLGFILGSCGTRPFDPEPAAGTPGTCHLKSTEIRKGLTRRSLFSAAMVDGKRLDLRKQAAKEGLGSVVASGRVEVVYSVLHTSPAYEDGFLHGQSQGGAELRDGRAYRVNGVVHRGGRADVWVEDVATGARAAPVTSFMLNR